MGDSSSHVKRSKSKKKKQETDAVTIPGSNSSIIPCSSTKKLFLWGLDCTCEDTSWYVVDIPIDINRQQLNEDMTESAAFDHPIFHPHIQKIGVQQTTVTPFFSGNQIDSPIPLVDNTYATLGSYVFSVGGTYDNLGYDPWYGTRTLGSNLVFYIDTNEEYDNYCWKQAPSMISGRRNPQVITVNHKLYVFGCSDKERCTHNPLCSTWAEVFDPSTNKWSSFPVPLFMSELTVCSPNHMKKNHVVKTIAVVVDTDWVGEFDTQTESWNHIASFGPNFGGYITNPVLVDSVLYWFTDDANAYDLIKDENFKGPVQDYSFHRAMNMVSDIDIDNNAIMPKVIHLVKRYFCVLAQLDDIDDNCRIHCMIIKLSKTKERSEHHYSRSDVEEFFLRARVISCHSFPIDQKLTYLDGRIM